MTINKEDLRVALERVRPGLASRELIEQSTSFAFLGDRVVTYNDEISVSHPVKDLDIRGAVKAEALYDFIARAPKDELEIEIEGTQLRIKAGRSRAGLVLEEDIRLPIEEVGKIGKWKKLPNGFLDGLKMSYHICSSDMSRPVLTCVHANGRYLEASDAYQIIRYELEEEIPYAPFLLPASSAKELLKYEGVAEISKGKGWVHFRTKDGTVFSARIFDGEFPTIDHLLEVEGSEITFTGSVMEALERAYIFARDSGKEMPVVTVTISEGSMLLRAEGESGWFEESLRVRYKGDRIRLMIGIESLITLLKQQKKSILGTNRMRIAGDSWVHVVATMVPEDE